MKEIRKKKLNSKGFSLVEVLLSIVILSILLVPILYGFVSAALVNTKAKEMQKATILAQNLMETIKSMTMEEVAIQFNGKEPFHLIRNDLDGLGVGYTIKRYVDEGYGEFIWNGSTYERVNVGSLGSSVTISHGVGGIMHYQFQPIHGRKQFHYVISDVKDQNGGFDVFVTLSTEVYSDSSKFPSTMNNFEIPRLLELDEDAVALIDLEKHIVSPDDQAIADFYNIRLSYLAYLASLALPTGVPTPTPTPTPPVITEEDIKAATSKDILIEVEKDPMNQRMIVTSQIIYHCNIDLNEDGSVEVSTPYMVSKGSYPIPEGDEEEGNIYLFYTPSQFTKDDSIKIINNGLHGNFYLVNQQEWNLTSKVNISKTDELGGHIQVYSNLQEMQKNSFVTIPYLYTKEVKHNRIYDVTVSIYKGGTLLSYPYGEAIVSLTSTKEE